MNSLQTILRDLKDGRISKAEALRRLARDQATQVQLFHSNWQARPAAAPSTLQGERILLVADRLGSLPGATPLTPGTGDALVRFEACAQQLLALLQSLLARGAGPGQGHIRLQVAIAQDDETLFALAALLQTAQLEDPRLHAQLIGLEPGTDVQALLDAELGQADMMVRYRAGQRLVLAVEPVANAPARHPWRANGVYLITGGAGGLGMLLARDILDQAAGARVILAGRSAPPTLPERMAYRQLDVSDSAAVHEALAAIRAEYGALNGILHCAGVLHDGYLRNLDAASLHAVLAPKAAGLLNLERASAADPLDMLVAFSSLAGALGNVGQGNYALANAFMDHVAAASTRVVSINWPLWQDGSMSIDPATEQALYERLGQRPLRTADGLQALYAALASGARRVLVAAGDVGKLRRLLAAPARAHAGTAPVQNAPQNMQDVQDTLGTLKALFASCTKFPLAQIDAYEPLQRYGIDSIMITRLNQKLEQSFGALPKTLLYEYHTLAALADYLNAHHVHRPTAQADAQMAPAPRQPAQEPIVIIGISGRYPQARTLDRYWHNLKTGRDCIGEIPPERWPLEGFFEPDHKKAVAQGKSYSKWGGFLEGFADFDPLFFGIAPREAQSIDPQERLFIETCHAALEDAALTREALAERYSGRVGVFAGITKTGFNLYGPALWQEGETLHPRTSFGSVANRVSYLFNLNGPSLPVDTMCSSSLTAIHMACEALHAGDCELAFAGGVNLYLHPSSYVELCASQMLAGDGRCKSFGDGGDGFVPGEGVGCVLLKPLARAIADGDQIHAVIRATHINHGGKTNGYTVPNPAAQSALIRAALDKAGVDARSIGYVEAHGTGTEMGDPIEVAGLAEAFRADTAEQGFCALGSAKSNIGHLEAAAGIAGLTKIVLQFRHRQLAPSLHAATLNRHIDFAASPFVVQQALAPWTRGNTPLRAALSSFGAGGANAHVVLEEYLAPAAAARPAHPPHPPHTLRPAVVILSARSKDALRERAAQLQDWLAQAGGEADPSALRQRIASLLHVEAAQLDAELPLEGYGIEPLHLAQLREEFGFGAELPAPLTIAALAAVQPRPSDVNLADLAYTLQVGREAMPYRLGCVVNSVQDLSAKLAAYLAGDDSAMAVGEALLGGEAQRAQDADPARQRARASGDPAQLLQLWLEGMPIDWSAMVRDGLPRRISLPTYPFARNRYWIAERQRATTAVAAAVHAAPAPIAVAPAAPFTPADKDFIASTIIAKLCAALDLQAQDVRGDQSFADYGLDSILGVNLVDELNQAFGIELDTTTLFDYSSLDKLCALVATLYRAPAPAPEPIQPAAPANAPRLAARADAIAIIGISGRFPQAESLQQLWRHLAEGRDLVEPVTRWPLPDDGGCRHGGFVDGIDRFDPLFFNISGLEATYMDPQQRIFLQEAWQALEDAGYAGAAVAGRACGVYVGCCGGDYQDLFLGQPSAQSLWGNMASVIPSRIAYYLDLKGPALAVDTACSSSLVAIDLACKDLRSGETEMALAGGVFLQATPKLYSAANRAGMLSSSGRCHAFAAQADGFVPGEGVGVLVLKRLADADADGDHIYGVIRGSGVNQDGATNGITAPSAKSQEALLRQIYQRFDIDPAAIGMLEAHGTGTKLGDPIEFGALSKAFRAYTERQQYCALGSIKTNIGHAQYAAGVAGVLKILLALKHQQIPPSLHFRNGNPAIAFEDSPFFVNIALCPWPAGARLAAVSSFGAGGTNSHLVIGEAPPRQRQHAAQSSWLIVLSARTQAQLEQQAGRLLAHCEQHPDLDCGNLSFTLLNGRKHGDQRLALVVSDLAALMQALRAPLSQCPPLERTRQLAATQAWEQGLALLADASTQHSARQSALQQLARAYADGAQVSTAGLFGDCFSRLPLPTTPFARESYWITLLETSPAVASAHPLLQRRLDAQSFAARFDGSEFFLADHQVQGKSIMPGVVSLELARAALAPALGSELGIGLRDVVWLRPMAGPAVALTITLSPTEGAVQAFRIHASDDPAHIYTQGVAERLAGGAPRQDLAALRAACTGLTVTREQCYAALRRIGIEHGPRLQAVQEIFVGERLALARLALPLADNALLLHPAMLDSAIQASIGLLLGQDRTALPFALQKLEVHAPCVPAMWAVIRSEISPTQEKFDIDLCDDSGQMCVRMLGYSARVLAPAAGQEVVQDPAAVLLQPVWDVQPLPAPQPHHGRMLVVGATPALLAQLQAYAPQTLDCDGSLEEIGVRLAALQEFDHLVWIGSRLPKASHEAGLLSAFHLIKALLGAGHDARRLCWTVLTTQCQALDAQDAVQAADAGLHGLFGSLAREYPNWRVRIADLEAGAELPFETIFGLPFDERGDAWLLRHAQWHRRVLLPFTPAASETTRYRQGGVYVVIGGAGGVAGVWTDYMVSTYGARVAWIGRSASDAALSARLAAYGGAVHYLRSDASDRVALAAARQEIESRLGPVHGVVHSAIVLQDQGLAKMDAQRLLASYRAKADTSIVVAEVFCQRPLDFLLFFSSIQSFAHMPGQSNYAAGCSFQDAYARHLGQTGATPVKVINWGYWGQVGIVASEHYRQRMAQAGLASIEAPEAMAALEALLGGSAFQLALLKTTRLAAVDGIDLGQQVSVYAPQLQPCVAALATVIRPQEEQVARMRARVGAQMSEMDTLLARLLFVQLREVGLFARQPAAAMRAQLPPLYGRWFDECLIVLQRHGWIDAAAVALRDDDAGAAWAEWEREKAPWMQDQHRCAQVVLVETMLRALPDILRQRRPATEAMFPQSSMRLVEGIYKNNLVADYFNDVLTDVLVAYVGRRIEQDPSARLRILEIGAGTGGTSARAFVKLRPFQQHIEEYCYTDLSKAFLMHAQREYGPQNPYLSYQLFNVGQPLAGQKINPGAFDIVIATNVLHATRNIRTTLRNAKAALRRNGLLLLNELSDNVLFSHLTFGLLEGWWLYDDPALRIPGSPGLFPQAWQAVLQQEGFAGVSFPAEAAHGMGQQIIVGESDGVVRQATPFALPPPSAAPAPVPVAAPVPAAAAAAAVQLDALRGKARAYFRALVGDTIRIPADEIAASEPLERYGIDSILVVQLTSRLRDVLSDISSTLLFEVQTIDGLIDHLLASQPQALAVLVGASAASELQPASQPASIDMPLLARATMPARAPVSAQDIAIIGLSGRYPKAPDLERFWENLRDGRNCVGEIPAERWNWRDYYDPEPGKAGAMSSKFGGFLERIDCFDPLFFHIAPAEAERMDPQERLFLQQAYAAIEDAGYTPAGLSGERKVGVFVGVMNGRYPTSAAFWSVANRVSYLLNLNGPSLAVDTACSSSLTALHLALESINSGSCDCALAGGVNLVLDPQHYITLSEMVMLSPSAECKSFGAQADGFIDAEGVGALLLKPLARALADGDHIYGVIKGSAINAGGKTNSYTVPSPLAQARVVQDACARAGVDPRTISYVEAHGTGTALGDPIEIAGLSRAFRASTDARQFCAVGSVKSNIGHCESAAGMAGVTKVLLQFKHGQLVPSLHAEAVNPEIDFAASPFRLQHTLQPWQRPLLDGVEVPRRAGVSSFGAGGANAHVVLEEFVAAERRAPAAGERVILLSARSEERLRLMAGNLLDYLSRHPHTDLADLAYTLQVGRVVMDHRLALLADSMPMAIDKLRSWLDNGSGCLSGSKPAGRRNALADVDDDADMRRTYASWAAQGQFERLMSLWVQGATLDWAGFAIHADARRISLPTYPFAEEAYWLAREKKSDATTQLHPLVQVNSSNLDGLRFSSSFSGHEFFLAEHLVQGQRVLPGMAYLEMARAAVALIGPAPNAQVVISNLVWSQPFTFGSAPATLHIGLQQEKEHIDFRIYSEAGQHSQGQAAYQSPALAATLDLAALQSRLTRGRFSGQQCYAAFEQLGIQYGPNHRALELVYAGDGEALAQLRLPGMPGAFSLHPGMMDAALQASLALMLDEHGQLPAPTPMLPFALARLELLAPLEDVMWVWVAPSATASANALQKLDFTLCNEAGQVCVRLLGFAARRLTASVAAAAPAAAPAPEPALQVSDNALRERTARYLKTLLSEATMLAAERIDGATEFEQYGLDSVMIIKFTAELEKSFGRLSKTLFFEYRTLDELSDYFIAAHGERLAAKFGSSQRAAAAIVQKASIDVVPRSRNLPAPPKAPPTTPAGSATDVAIIGLAGRYPKAPTLAQFWANLCNGVDCITEVPAERWDHSRFYRADLTGPTNSKWGGFLDGVDMFDPLFFNMSPRDAAMIDPQERLFLETAYHALEDAGYTRQTLAAAGGRVGVFVGVMYEEYQLYGAELTAQGRPISLAGSPSSIANRVSFYFDLNGPSMAVDTMCSSSLTALHLACQALQQGDCEMVLAGGVNLTLHPNKYLALGQGKFASSKGRCVSFGEGGDGYVPAEGVGAVLLKPLAQAEADGDHIYGVIKGSAVNHGGKANSYTVPSPRAQAAVVSRAFEKAGIAPRTVSYIEAHGTGTALGDPIEIAGLCSSFRADTAGTGFCAIGSAKSNIGHCESAAGIAGLTKVLLQMRHRQLVPSLHSSTLNPNIDFAGSPFVVQQQLAPWRRPQIEVDGVLTEVPLRAGISSFGAGGANAHVLIEEYVAPSRPLDEGTQLLLLSAKTTAQLVQRARDLLQYLEQETPSLAELAYTLQTGREAMDERFGMVAGSLAELQEGLQDFLAGREPVRRQYSGNIKAGKAALSAFADEDLRAAIDSWIAKGKLEKLLELWVQGLPFDWHLLHRGQRPARISLPLYPFARERYWMPSGVAGGVPQAAAPVMVAPIAAAVPPSVSSNVVLMYPQWREAAGETGPAPGGAASPQRRIVLLCGVNADAGIDASVIALSGADAGARFASAATALFEILQGLVKEKLRAPVLLQIAVPQDGEGALCAGLAAMLKTAQLENPQLHCQLIALPAGAPLAAMLDAESARPQTPHVPQVLYRDGRRYQLQHVELASSGAPVLPWREQGVYLISGGAGAVGLCFARAIRQHAPRATVIVCGRAAAAAGLVSAGIVYRQLDVADADAVQDLIDKLSKEYGGLTGMLHSAGALHDSYLLKKTRAEFDAVLAPKVRGLVNLDLATRSLPLEFFVAFSSLAAVSGNPGQADYATANAFLDQYAAYRNRLVQQGARSGRSLSLNWPLWAEGGMRPDPATVKLMQANFGLAPMANADGLAAFYQALASGHDQVLVAAGERARVLSLFDCQPPPAAPVPVPVLDMHDRLRALLRQLAADLIKVAPEVLDLDMALSEYGYESVSMTELANGLNQEFNLALTPTICFEYPTIAALADYLVSAHRPQLVHRFGESATPAEVVTPAAPAQPLAVTSPPLAAASPPAARAVATPRAHSSAATGAAEPLAIIGMSGCMPKAADLDEFWQNLQEGRDCISEIPPSRWDWQALYGDPAREPGKCNIKWGGFIDGIGEFDPLFFGISPREAEVMDPQQRLLMTYVWKALEDAGYAAASLSGSRTALFVGTGNSGYGSLFSSEQRSMEAYSATSGVPSIGPNRISYLLNLRGPSEPIETACSSSLVALNRGVAVLRDGSCNLAVVGGVNTIVTPEAHISFSKAGMLSQDGRCKTFSAQADGYVRGEGVGMLVLKRLVDAERDGDHIYGLIRGCAENHGGRATSLTAPNPQAQAELLAEAYARAGVDPRTVTYIEAHGTGTKLGDPVEISGLKSAFAGLGGEAYCGLGSVKSNIGHLELAAGVAGVIKVLLQMKHQTLVRSLHCEQPNPYIDLVGSPFYLVTENAPWNAMSDDQGRTLPRRAGVSSFGFGGVNAHVVLEEYRAPEPVTAMASGPCLILLSARTGERLTEMAANLLRFLQHEECSLAALAWTLQVGRDAMEERLCWSVSSLAELRDRLQAFVAKGELCGGLRGQVKRNKEALAALSADEDSAALLDAWIAKGKYSRLLDLWSKGLEIDWRRLYPHGRPSRLSLPTYPFAREIYWAVPAATAAKPAAVSAGAKLHPLVHVNTSDFSEQRFTSRFSGEEFFLADHRVQGQRILPGMAHLEMARAAIAQTLGEQAGIALCNVVWTRPYIATETPAPLHVALTAQDDGGIAFEIYSDAGMHSQGQAEIGAAAAPETLDLAALQKRIGHSTWSGAQVYSAFARFGIDYGPGHRGIASLYAAGSEVLARLELPSASGGHGGGFVLHPGLLDAAVQAAIGLTPALLDGGTDGAPMLPFALQRVELLAPCGGSMWAWVTAQGNRQDIALCDDEGRICLRLSGFSIRRVNATPALVPSVPVPALAFTSASEPAPGALAALVSAALVPLVASLIKVNPEDIALDSELSEYGYDSISLTELANRLNQQYELDLMPTLFFECPSIAALASYLAEVHQDVFARRLVPRAAPMETVAPVVPMAPVAPAAALRRLRSAPAATTTSSVRASAGPDTGPDPIAIIGISCCLPMAENLGAFWQNLLEGRDCISEIPPSRWDWQAYFGDPNLEPRKTNVKWAGFIDGVDSFDPQFFGITPREAEVMDPQQRLLMMYVWKALEDAGIAPHSLSGSHTALFIGSGASTYGQVLAQSARADDGFGATATVASIGPNRMSYFLDLHGPSEPIETACSSSLVALNRGVAVLRDGSCNLAVVGGVNTIVTPDAHISFSKAGMLSQDGRCKTFSAQANGYGRGEGVGMLVLKRLADAERDGDHVYGLIRGCAENHGGRASSLTAPNPLAQAALLRDAYARAGVDPGTVSYIEAHGTGTKLGDPVEINGLKSAFQDVAGERSCGLGSVKSNIGHLELAAGVAGVIKVLLQMKHKTLVRSLHCEQPNPYIDLAGSPFYLVTENAPWHAMSDDQGRTLPRRAGVSSFGFGGVNAHVVLEEYLATEPAVAPEARPCMIVLSARDASLLPSMAAQLLRMLQDAPCSLPALAWTLQSGREAMDERLGWLVSSQAELIACLQAYVADGALGTGVRGQVARNRDALALLAGDDDAGQLFDTWLAKGKLGRLLELWSKGFDFDWRRLYHGTPPRRISAPTYPFARQRCWPALANVTADEAAVPSSDADLSAQVVAIAAGLSGLTVAELTPDANLHQLGLDSVCLLQIAAALTRAFPQLDRQTDGDALLRCASIGELVACVERGVSVPTAPTATLYAFVPPPRPSSELSLQPPPRDPQNRLCEDLRLEAGEPISVKGRVVVDESHPFFFDHPLDHISGLQLGAAICEAARLAHLQCSGLEPETALLVSALRLDFVELCRKLPEARVAVSATEKAGAYQASVSQEGRTTVRATLLIRPCEPRAEGPRAPLPAVRPAPRELLNKRNPANVLLSEVGGSVQRPGCWLLPQSGANFFTDFPHGLIDAVVLAEAARQGLRLFFSANQPHQRSASEHQVDLLKTLEVRLDRPLYWDEGVYLELVSHDKLEVGSATRLHLNGRFLVGGVAVGSFVAGAMSLSADLHQQWNAPGRGGPL